MLDPSYPRLNGNKAALWLTLIHYWHSESDATALKKCSPNTSPVLESVKIARELQIAGATGGFEEVRARLLS